MACDHDLRLLAKVSHGGRNQIICSSKMTSALFLRWPLDLPAAMVVVMAAHVLHGDPAPHANDKRFDLAFVLATGDAEIPVLPPVLSPGVCRYLKKGKRDFKFLHANEKF